TPSSLIRRSCSKASTAMSASQTGDDDGPLVHCLIGLPNIDSANSPASRTAALSCAAARAEISVAPSASMAGNGETLHAHSRRIGAIAEDEVIGRLKLGEHLGKVSSYRDLADRISRHTVDDPKPGRAPAVIAGHQVDAGAD